MASARLLDFAVRLHIPRLHDAVVWELFQLHADREFPPFTVVELAYRYPYLRNSVLVKLLTAWYV